MLADSQIFDSQTVEELMPQIYDELRALAGVYLQGERVDHTMQATALVHEAFLRLAGSESRYKLNRSQLMSAAAKTIRHILVDHARSNLRLKRGGGMKKLLLHDSLIISDKRSIDLEALNEALDQLAVMDARLAKVVELRYFAGLSTEEVAELLEVSSRTIENDWRLAKAWLRTQLVKGE